MKTPDLKSRILLIARIFLLRGMQYFKFTQFFPAFVFDLVLILISLSIVLFVIFVILIFIFGFLYQISPEILGFADTIKNGLSFLENFDMSWITADFSENWKSILFKFYLTITLVFYGVVEIYKKISDKKWEPWSFKERSKYTLYFLLATSSFILFVFTGLIISLSSASLSSVFLGVGGVVLFLFVVGLILNFYGLLVSYIINGLIEIVDNFIEKMDEKYIGANVDFDELS